MKYAHLLTLILFSSLGYSQSNGPIRLDSCYVWARQNFPLLKQRNVIALTKKYTIENAWRNYLPEINANGQATYQSEVVNIKDALGSLSNLPPPLNSIANKFPTYSKDQYRITCEVY